MFSQDHAISFIIVTSKASQLCKKSFTVGRHVSELVDIIIKTIAVWFKILHTSPTAHDSKAWFPQYVFHNFFYCT